MIFGANAHCAHCRANLPRHMIFVANAHFAHCRANLPRHMILCGKRTLHSLPRKPPTPHDSLWQTHTALTAAQPPTPHDLCGKRTLRRRAREKRGWAFCVIIQALSRSAEDFGRFFAHRAAWAVGETLRRWTLVWAPWDSRKFNFPKIELSRGKQVYPTGKSNEPVERKNCNEAGDCASSLEQCFPTMAFRQLGTLHHGARGSATAKGLSLVSGKIPDTRCVDAWKRGCVEAWMRGSVDAWKRGCVGSRQKGWICG